ncbi:MAG TPA: prolyl oligopeptidase family serine peptidase [Holophagaceae bacterium]|nr:prolyl oligopeptidase family serine peptidase [Holophagaceae bacterium]
MRKALMTLAITGSLFAQAPIQYPETRKDAVVDDYFGTKVADPYRWLEDDNSAETKAWVGAENKVAFGYLNAIPERDAIKARLTKLYDYEKYSAPFQQGGRYFFSYNKGLEPQAKYYWSKGLKGAPQVLIDPNTLSKDGTVALSGLSITHDGKRVAYALAEAGSDWITWHVRDVATGKDLPDVIHWSKAGGASWLRDGSGFYYSRFDAPKAGDALKGINQNHQVFFHKLGTPQSEDLLVYKRPDHPDWYLGANVTDDGRWLVISAGKGTDPKSSLFIQDLSKAGSKVEPLLDAMDASYGVIGNDGDTFFIHTDKDAPRYRLVAIRAGHTGPSEWKELIPESKGRDVLDGVSFVGNQFVANWMHDAHTRITFHDLKGKETGELKLPAIGTAGGFAGERTDMEAFYTFTSFTYPPTIYRYDFKTGKSEVFRAPKVEFNPAAYETKQVFYPSKDGTKIPMFLTYKKGLKLDGTNPTLLYAYGGFNISLTPSFSTTRVAWLEMGGVYAMANLRGGGEYGMDWYNAGRLKNKQNVFDDFISAAEWLIQEKYTSTPKLAIQGGSNGGLLIGACETQRPDLFGACLPAVGVMDMLRFHLFTLGWGWKSDYGSSETKEGFDTLIKYSPLHNIKPGVKYPPTLVTTSDHDDRVVPAHSFKFAATMQADQAGPAPILIRVETRAGHGAGKPTDKILAEIADEYAFLVKNLDIKLPEGYGK